MRQFQPRHSTLHEDIDEMRKLVGTLQKKLQRIVREHPILAVGKFVSTASKKNAEATREWLKGIDENLAKAFEAGDCNLRIMQGIILGLDNALLRLEAHVKPRHGRSSRNLDCYVIDSIISVAKRCGIRDKKRQWILIDWVFSQVNMNPPTEKTYRRWLAKKAQQSRTKIGRF